MFSSHFLPVLYATFTAKEKPGWSHCCIKSINSLNKMERKLKDATIKPITLYANLKNYMKQYQTRWGFLSHLKGKRADFPFTHKNLPPTEIGHLPSVKSTKLFPMMGEGTEIPIAFRTPCMLTTSPGVTCCVSSLRLLVTCSARKNGEKKLKVPKWFL